MDYVITIGHGEDEVMLGIENGKEVWTRIINEANQYETRLEAIQAANISGLINDKTKVSIKPI